MGLNARKPSGFANNKGATQPANPCSMIIAFVIHILESIIIISRLATGEISIFFRVSVAQQAGLKLALSDTPKTGFLALGSIL